MEVGLVLLRQSRKVDIGIGEVDTLAGRNETVVASPGFDGLVVLDAQDVESKDTIIDVDDTARLNDLGDVLVVNIPGTSC